MLSLEQVRLLESRIAKTIALVRSLTDENAGLRERLDACQKRTDELEALIHSFKEEQSRIEDGILSALDRLNQFEDAVEQTAPAKAAAAPAKTVAAPPSEPPAPAPVAPASPQTAETPPAPQAPSPLSSQADILTLNEEPESELDIF